MHQRVVQSLRTLGSFVLVAAIASPAAAQCRVGKNTNEAKLLAYYGAPLSFSPSGMLGGLDAGDVRLGFEITLIPAPDDALRQTSECFLPKDENSQLSPVFPRPHLAIGITSGLFAEFMYLPPVTVMDATPNLFSAALGWASPNKVGVGLALRAHTTFGEVSGPITCNEDDLQQQSQNVACYGREKSDDTYKPNIIGAEAALTWRGAGKFAGYAGAGINSLRPRFQVGFTMLNGAVDNTQVEPENLTRLVLMAGGSYRLSPRIALTSELYSVPEDMTTLRIGGAWNIR